MRLPWPRGYLSNIRNKEFDLLGPGSNFWGASRILVGGWSFPACFLKRELDCNCLAIFCYNVRASLHSSILEELARLVHLCVPKLRWVVQSSGWVHACRRSRLWTIINCRAKSIATRCRSLHVACLSAENAALLTSSRKFTRWSSRIGSLWHITQN